MKKNKILVTGGAGFIGSLANKMLNHAGYETVVLDNLCTGHREAVTQGEFIEGDIGSRVILEKIFNTYNIQAVIHFAASIDVGESVHNPDKYYRNNVINTLNLLNSMLDFEIENLIFSSSAAVYGTPEEIPIKESHPLNPINPYGETKLIIEKVLHDFDYAYGLKYCSLRYFNAAGGDPEGEIPNCSLVQHNLIPRVLRSLTTPEGKFTIFGTDYPTPDGTNIRDYIHIFDLGVAHIKAMENLLAGGESCCYNLGNGNGYSVREVIEATELVTGKKVNIVEGERREGDPVSLVADAAKAKEELGWEPRFPDLEAMIDHAWKAMRVKR